MIVIDLELELDLDLVMGVVFGQTGSGNDPMTILLVVGAYWSVDHTLIESSPASSGGVESRLMRKNLDLEMKSFVQS